MWAELQFASILTFLPLGVCGDEPPEKGQSCFRARNEAEVCTSHSSTRPARGKFGQNLGVGFSGETRENLKGLWLFVGGGGMQVEDVSLAAA